MSRISKGYYLHYIVNTMIKGKARKKKKKKKKKNLSTLTTDVKEKCIFARTDYRKLLALHHRNKGVRSSVEQSIKSL